MTLIFNVSSVIRMRSVLNMTSMGVLCVSIIIVSELLACLLVYVFSAGLGVVSVCECVLVRTCPHAWTWTYVRICALMHTCEPNNPLTEYFHIPVSLYFVSHPAANPHTAPFSSLACFAHPNTNNISLYFALPSRSHPRLLCGVNNLCLCYHFLIVYCYTFTNYRCFNNGNAIWFC